MNNKMAIVGFLIAFVGGVVYKSTFLSDNNPVLDPTLTTIAVADVETMKHTIKNLVQTNRELVEQLQLIKSSIVATPATNNVSSVHAQSMPVKKTETQQSQEDFSQRDVMAHVNEFNKIFQEKNQKNSHYNFTADLAQQFDAEPVDINWADEQQRTVNHFFREQKNLADIVPESVVCKSERCRIRIPAASVEEANHIGVAFSEALSNSKDFNHLRMLSANDNERGMIEIYLPKDSQVNLFK